MTCKRLQRLILTWVRGPRLWLIHLGTPCTRWSAARTTGAVEPGSPTAASSARSSWSGCSVPAGKPASSSRSRTRGPPPSKSGSRSPPSSAGRPPSAPTSPSASTVPPTYKKPTTLPASDHAFDTLTRTCKCTEHRERLQGLVHVGGKWRWKTSFASAYPPRLARSYAAVAESLAPRSAYRDHGARKLDPRWEEALAGAWHWQRQSDSGSRGPRHHVRARASALSQPLRPPVAQCSSSLGRLARWTPGAANVLNAPLLVRRSSTTPPRAPTCAPGPSRTPPRPPTTTPSGASPTSPPRVLTLGTLPPPPTRPWSSTSTSSSSKARTTPTSARPRSPPSAIT